MTVTAPARTPVLCVDDEPWVLEGLSVLLRRRFDLVTADSGSAGLESLKQRPAAVVVSDMRMPGMDGATFLKRSMDIVPDASRILLTGQSDVEAAVVAVNEGRIFRFLEKPCPPALLIGTIDAAARQYRLATAEKVLLEQTLRGSIQALTDVLALTSPLAFGRAMRIREHVADLVRQLAMPECWQVDVAAMVCQLGSVALPAETVSKLYFGQPMTEEETQMVGRMPAVTEQLLANIPRLETVLAMLSGQTRPFRPSDRPTPDSDEALALRGAELLKVSADFELLQATGLSAAGALETMRGRLTRYEPAVLNAFVELRGVTAPSEQVREVALSALQVGMVLADDLTTAAGLLLAARGYRVTAGFVERVRNVASDPRTAPVRVIVPTVAPAPEVA